MKRQLKSILAGLLCVACLPVIPVETSALEWERCVVVGIKENGSCIVAERNGETYTISSANKWLPDGAEPLALGDMLAFQDGWCMTEYEWGKTDSLAPMRTPEPGVGMLYKTGSVLDETETAVFTVTKMDDCCWLTDGEKEYHICTDWMEWGYEQLGYVDWSGVEAGDQLRCYVVEGVPVAAIMEVQPYYMIVVGVAENGGCVLLPRGSGEAVSVSGKQIAEALPEGVDRLACGDIIQFADGVGGIQTALGGNAVNSMTLFANDDYTGKTPLESGSIYKVGSVLDDMETAEFLVSGDKFYPAVCDGEKEYLMITSWQYGNGYQRLGNVNWEDVEPGDTLECIVYNGRPVIALEVASTTLDENGESDYAYIWGNTQHSIYRLYTDAFHYTNYGSCYYYYPSDDAPAETFYEEESELRTDAVNANCVVTGVFYETGGTKPAYYTVNKINDGVQFDRSANVDASELERYLSDQVLTIGDLLYMDHVWQSSYPPPYDVEFHHAEDGYTESVVEYAGNGVELFGEDFKKVLRQELKTTPALREGREGYYLNTANGLFDKGKITDDDEIDIVDCIALNKHLLTGYDIGYCGQLAADVDNNGVVNATDSLNILKYAVGIIDSFEQN